MVIVERDSWVARDYCGIVGRLSFSQDMDTRCARFFLNIYKPLSPPMINYYYGRVYYASRM